MLTAVLVLLALILGILIGWFARTMQDALKAYTQQADEKRNIEKQKNDGSGVIVNKQPYQRGQVVQLPSYDPKTNTTSGIIRARSPEQVKKDSDREWNQFINESK